MKHVHAGVVGLDGSVGLAPLHITADGVVTHAERENLLVVEYVLNNDNRTAACLIGLLVGMVFLLRIP